MNEPPKQRKYRKVPSEKAGYAPGLWVVQYHDPDMGVWFDIGDPRTEESADELLTERRIG